MKERNEFVDEHDQPIGIGTREEAWAKGIYKRLAVTLVTDGAGNVLLQKRSESKKIYPGRWTTSASGHVDEGENYETAAKRELQEEMGIEAELTYVGKFRLKEAVGDKNARMFVSVFSCIVPADTSAHIEEGEVSEARWFRIDELSSKLASSPTLYTPDLANPLIVSYLKSCA